MITGCWDVQFKWRLFGKSTFQLGWRNRAGFGPIEEFTTFAEAEKARQDLERGAGKRG